MIGKTIYGKATEDAGCVEPGICGRRADTYEIYV